MAKPNEPKSTVLEIRKWEVQYMVDITAVDLNHK